MINCTNSIKQLQLSCEYFFKLFKNALFSYKTNVSSDSHFKLDIMEVVNNLKDSLNKQDNLALYHSDF